MFKVIGNVSVGVRRQPSLQSIPVLPNQKVLHVNCDSGSEIGLWIDEKCKTQVVVRENGLWIVEVSLVDLGVIGAAFSV